MAGSASNSGSRHNRAQSFGGGKSARVAVWPGKQNAMGAMAMRAVS